MPDTNPGASNVVSLNTGNINAERPALTIKQEAFCQAIASGLYPTQSAAYRIAYEAESMSAASISQEASRLMSDPRISARIDEIKALKEAGERLDHAKIRAHVVARLHIESLDPDSSPASRIRALELLGKLGGVAAFERQAEDTSLPQDADSVARALKAKLESLMKTGT
jgi:phage terminase small subunit